MEKIASYSLAFIFDIENPENSKSLGNKNTSLSFNQKLNLLFDSGSIEKEEKERMEIFMEVRNQFMHNLNVDSFSDVFKLLDGRTKRLKKLYPSYFSDDIELEKSLDTVTEKLYLEGMKTLRSFKGARSTKLDSIANATIYKKYYNTTPKAIDKALRMLIKDINGDTFEWSDKTTLIENIEILKKQILTYQLFDEEE
ncbi:hypothetical protein ACU8DI_14840 [Psychroserpens sp. BH13MA-6]